MLRVQLCVLSVAAVCVSGKESFAVKDTSTGEAESHLCAWCIYTGINSITEDVFLYCCIHLNDLVTYIVELSAKNIQPRGQLATTKVTCISSWQDLVLQKETKMIPLLPTTRSLPPLLLIHIHIDASNASDFYNSTKYCQLTEPGDECATVAAYSQSIFAFYPFTLLVSLSLVSVHHPLSETIMEISWTLQMPFCSEHYQLGILEDFVHYEVSNCVHYSPITCIYTLSFLHVAKKHIIYFKPLQQPYT